MERRDGGSTRARSGNLPHMFSRITPRSLPVPPPSPLTRGRTGDRVLELQKKLVTAKLLTQADFKSGPGVFGPRTSAAVKHLQELHGLPATGLVNAATWAALEAQLAPRKTPIDFADEVTAPLAQPLSLR